MSSSLQPHGLYPPLLLCPRDFSGKNTGVGYHFLLQGISPTQGLNECLLYLLHCRRILYPLSHQRSLSAQRRLKNMVKFQAETQSWLVLKSLQWSIVFLPDGMKYSKIFPRLLRSWGSFFSRAILNFLASWLLDGSYHSARQNVRHI